MQDLRATMIGVAALMSLEAGRRFEHEHNRDVIARDAALRATAQEAEANTRLAAEQRIRAEVDRHIAAAVPDSKATWRTTMAKVDQVLASGELGQMRSDLSRQEIRAMKRDIAKSEATVAREAARREAKVARKRRRAGLG